MYWKWPYLTPILALDADGQTTVKFGVLFNDDRCANIFEALVGTLKAAKKKKVVDFKGELLLQGVHDNVDVVLLKEWDPTSLQITVSTALLQMGSRFDENCLDWLDKLAEITSCDSVKFQKVRQNHNFFFQNLLIFFFDEHTCWWFIFFFVKPRNFDTCRGRETHRMNVVSRLTLLGLYIWSFSGEYTV